MRMVCTLGAVSSGLHEKRSGGVVAGCEAGVWLGLPLSFFVLKSTFTNLRTRGYCYGGKGKEELVLTS